MDEKKEINSIDDIFGVQEWVKGFKKENGIDSNYLENKPYLNNLSEDKIYLAITNTQTNETSLYILDINKPQYDNKIKQLDVDKTYKKFA